MTNPTHYSPGDPMRVPDDARLSNGAPHPYRGRTGVVLEVRTLGTWPVRVQLDDEPGRLPTRPLQLAHTEVEPYTEPEPSKESIMNPTTAEHVDTPPFPMPQDVPLPSWATESGEWTWESFGRGWERSVGRATEIEGVLLDNRQYVSEEGGPVGLITPDGLTLSVLDDDRTVDELAALGRFFLDAADAMRRAEA